LEVPVIGDPGTNTIKSVDKDGKPVSNEW